MSELPGALGAGLLDGTNGLRGHTMGRRSATATDPAAIPLIVANESIAIFLLGTPLRRKDSQG
jgi:hypothetical protein